MTVKKERMGKKLGWKKERVVKKARLVNHNAVRKKMVFKERAMKKKIINKDPAQRRLMEKERKAARKVRLIAHEKTRKARRQARLQRFKIRKMRHNVVKRVEAHETTATKVIKQYAHKLGIKTHKTVHFNVKKKKHNKALNKATAGKYVELHHANAIDVQDAKDAFAPNQAQRAASTAVEEVDAAVPEEEEHYMSPAEARDVLG